MSVFVFYRWPSERAEQQPVWCLPRGLTQLWQREAGRQAGSTNSNSNSGFWLDLAALCVRAACGSSGPETSSLNAQYNLLPTTLLLLLLSSPQSNMPYELDAASLNTFGECDMNGQLQTPVLAAHYRIMPGRQQLQAQPSNGNGNGHSNALSQEQQQQQMHWANAPDGRTLVGFSFNSKIGSGAEMLFYEFAGERGWGACSSWKGRFVIEAVLQGSLFSCPLQAPCHSTQ